MISLWPFSNLPPVTVRLFPRETNEITYVGRHSFTNIIGEVLCNTYVFSTFYLMVEKLSEFLVRHKTRRIMDYL